MTYENFGLSLSRSLVKYELVCIMPMVMVESTLNGECSTPSNI